MAELIQWLDAHAWAWPAFIILARVVDVSLGTVRTISVVRGRRFTAAVLGFFEVVVWISAVSGVLQDADTVKIISYAVGFALGNTCGIIIEQKVGLGTQMVMFISDQRSHSVAFALRLAGFMVTEVPARGEHDEVAMGFAVVSRRQVNRLVVIARGVDPKVHVTIHDVRDTTLGFPATPAPLTGWRAILKKK